LRPGEARRIPSVQVRLLRWFSSFGRSFPWRATGISTFERVISEILLQRTRAQTVHLFFESFFRRFPDWRSLAESPEEEIAAFLRPVGLRLQRAASLQRLGAEMVLRRGKFPRTREEIEALPGIGQYVASAVLLFEFRQPAPLLDVNMARVLERYFGARDLADIRRDPRLQALATMLVEHDRSVRLNWATLDLAAVVCRQNVPVCASCPLKRGCAFVRAPMSVRRGEHPDDRPRAPGSNRPSYFSASGRRHESPRKSGPG
jgi:A/G-specific adenine glycosylase